MIHNNEPVQRYICGFRLFLVFFFSLGLATNLNDSSKAVE